MNARDWHWFLSGASGIAWGVWLGDMTLPRLTLACTLTLIQMGVSLYRAWRGYQGYPKP